MDTDDRVGQLEERIRRLEDVVEIYRLMATYGPAVDSSSKEAAASLWTEDGEYNIDLIVLEGRKAIEDMVVGDSHQGHVKAGASHQIAMPLISLEGDTAVALGYASLIVREGDSHVIRRQVATRWDLVRQPEGWRVKLRTNRLLDGSLDARALLRVGLKEAKA